MEGQARLADRCNFHLNSHGSQEQLVSAKQPNTSRQVSRQVGEEFFHMPWANVLSQPRTVSWGGWRLFSVVLQGDKPGPPLWSHWIQLACILVSMPRL